MYVPFLYSFSHHSQRTGMARFMVQLNLPLNSELAVPPLHRTVSQGGPMPLHTRSAFLECPCPTPSNSYIRTRRHRRIPPRRGTVAIGAFPSSSVASLAGQDIPRPAFIYLLPLVVLPNCPSCLPQPLHPTTSTRSPQTPQTWFEFGGGAAPPDEDSCGFGSFGLGEGVGTLDDDCELARLTPFGLWEGTATTDDGNCVLDSDTVP